jgi:hypothetical protein
VNGEWVCMLPAYCYADAGPDAGGTQDGSHEAAADDASREAGGCSDSGTPNWCNGTIPQASPEFLNCSDSPEVCVNGEWVCTLPAFCYADAGPDGG